MKSPSANRRRLFILVSQFSFAVPPVGVLEFALRAAVKRRPALGCQTDENRSDDDSGFGIEP